MNNKIAVATQTLLMICLLAILRGISMDSCRSASQMKIWKYQSVMTKSHLCLITFWIQTCLISNTERSLNFWVSIVRWTTSNQNISSDKAQTFHARYQLSTRMASLFSIPWFSHTMKERTTPIQRSFRVIRIWSFCMGWRRNGWLMHRRSRMWENIFCSCVDDPQLLLHQMTKMKKSRPLNSMLRNIPSSSLMVQLSILRSWTSSMFPTSAHSWLTILCFSNIGSWRICVPSISMLRSKKDTTVQSLIQEHAWLSSFIGNLN